MIKLTLGTLLGLRLHGRDGSLTNRASQGRPLGRDVSCQGGCGLGGQCGCDSVDGSRASCGRFHATASLRHLGQSLSGDW